MTFATLEIVQATTNPLDQIEELVLTNDWPFERASEDEMVVEIRGRWTNYRLYFVWQHDISALQFCCQFELRVPDARRREVHDLLARLNERLWVGHFDICSDEKTPMFRHTCLLRGIPAASAEQIEDLVEIAVNECERFFPAFQLVIWGGQTAPEAVEAAILETEGEA